MSKETANMQRSYKQGTIPPYSQTWCSRYREIKIVEFTENQGHQFDGFKTSDSISNYTRANVRVSSYYFAILQVNDGRGQPEKEEE